MKRTPFALAALLVVLGPGIAYAQARGPSAEDVQENGQHIAGRRERREQAQEEAEQQEEQERETLRDPAVRAQRFARLDTWFRRLPGRFRIEGKITKPVSVTIPGASIFVTREGDIKGIADCQEVGEGVGVQCVISASWPIIDASEVTISFPPHGGGKMPPIPSPSDTEMLDTMRPAMLMLGLNLDPPGIRALLVNADSLAHSWVGTLKEDTARANRVNRCMSQRCIQPLQIIAKPDSEVVTIILQSGRTTLTFTMIRDPEARAEKPVKSLKAR